MGCAGAGKTTVGRAAAAALGWAFVDADDLHPASNLEKLRAGEALTDADRAPWLRAVRAAMVDRARQAGGVVVACSALTRAYRDALRGGPGGSGEAGVAVRFALLDAPEAELERRVRGRAGHPMPASLVASQVATLERPGPAEPDALTLDATGPIGALIGAVWGLGSA